MKSFTHLTYELSLIETLDAFQMGIGAHRNDSLEVRLPQIIKDSYVRTLLYMFVNPSNSGPEGKITIILKIKKFSKPF